MILIPFENLVLYHNLFVKKKELISNNSEIEIDFFYISYFKQTLISSKKTFIQIAYPKIVIFKNKNLEKMSFKSNTWMNPILQNYFSNSFILMLKQP